MTAPRMQAFAGGAFSAQWGERIVVARLCACAGGDGSGGDPIGAMTQPCLLPHDPHCERGRKSDDAGSAGDDGRSVFPGEVCPGRCVALLMCFSATASFAASGVIGAVGIATLIHVRQPRAIPFAALPILFALHQFVEGFVWLGMEERISQLATDHVVFLYLLYAKGILPLLIPFAVTLMEPAGWRRTAVTGLTVLGAALGGWILCAVVAWPSGAIVQQHSIRYINEGTGGLLISGLYILTTCGALLLSSHRVVRWFGVLNVAGLTVVMLVKGYAFASVWCFYAAVLSVMLYWQFSRKNIDVLHPNRRLVIAA